MNSRAARVRVSKFDYASGHFAYQGDVMSDWKHRAAVEIVNELATSFETGDVPQAEMEAFVINVIAGHSASLADE